MKMEKVDPKLDLVLERTVDVPPEKMWQAWTDPNLLVQWFTPAPWKTVSCELELRPGGKFLTTMQSPEGELFPNEGCVLEVIKNEKLMFTDALGPGFRPREGAFMTAAVYFEPHGKGTKYTAIAFHKDEESRRKHEEMGFHPGWNAALDQMIALIKKSNEG